MEPCVERGMDVLAGGAKYNSIGTAGVGTSNVADTLAVIKKFVFEDKKYTGAELLEAIRSNWEGKEALRNEIMTGAPKYGNDDPYVDELARWSTSVFTERLNESWGPRGPYLAGLWPVAVHMAMGMWTSATLDGRKKGQPLADGISPMQGMDKHGPTAVLKSAKLLDQFGCYNGTLLNMKFHPNAVRGHEGTFKLRSLIQTYFDMKGMHVQLNVVSVDTLKEAQKNPDQYRNLVVRVAGYSAFFVELHKELQDDIISRTEHTAP
jgi:formate C-acetyltransferase